MSKTIVAFSGGKDSTAVALLEAEKGNDFSLLYTPAGNEPPEWDEHVKRIADLINRPLVVISNRDLDFWIKEFKALPNFRQRWCTRLLKIEPAKVYLAQHPGSTLLIGLRADEPLREGLYGDFCTYRYPLREARMGIADVYRLLDERGVKIPSRRGGNCMLCFFQGIGEWYQLWRDDPAEYQRGVDYEAETAHTFRTPGRDSWATGLADLRRQFESGKAPKHANQLPLLADTEICRVCSL
jgi:hypothetical protein